MEGPDRDWLGMEPLKDESPDAVGTELGLLSASLGFFLVSDAHLFFTALSVLQSGWQICTLLLPSLVGCCDCELWIMLHAVFYLLACKGMHLQVIDLVCSASIIGQVGHIDAIMPAALHAS